MQDRGLWIATLFLFAYGGISDSSARGGSSR
jgi:hypothetical protein